MTPIDKLHTRFEAEIVAVNALIRERMGARYAQRIGDVADHLISAGGKQIRPLLPIAVAEIFDYAGAGHITLGATIEYIHTATLLHDDVVDESQRRRGKPTAHLLWDNKSSILVGDYLFSRAFQMMTDIGSLKILRLLSDASAQIAEGEVLQLIAARQLSTDSAAYLQIIQAKTATLFAAATQSGGMLCGVSPEQETALHMFGEALGISFQLVDDWLDYMGTDALGKNTGDDLREGKLTLPVILALEKASSDEISFWERVLVKGELKAGDIEEAKALMQRHGALEATRQAALDWAERAKEALTRLPRHSVCDMLAELSDYVVSRMS